MNELMAHYTGQPIEEMEKNVERDKFFPADEAKAFGLVDEVFEKLQVSPSSGEGAPRKVLLCGDPKAGIHNPGQ